MVEDIRSVFFEERGAARTEAVAMDGPPSLSAEARRRLADLEPGDHMACILGFDEARRTFLCAFVQDGLERGDKVLCLESRVNEVPGFLSEEGMSPGSLLEAGRLEILPAERTYTREDRFVPERMIDLLAEETRAALSGGYRALRVAGEMSWALSGIPGSERLVEYEARVNDFFRDRPCLALCQYDRRRFHPATLMGVLLTHPVVGIDMEVVDNPYYVPPDRLLGPQAEASRLDTWIRTLLERKRFEDRVQEAREALEAQVAERTRALSQTNERLRREVQERKQTEAALQQKEQELEAQARHLEEVNTAMRVLLQHREEEKGRLQREVAANVHKLVLPYMDRLEASSPAGDMRTFLEIVRSNLEDLTAPFARSLSGLTSSLTPTEIRVADMIRHGKSTKEMAALLSVSANAVSVHRHNIRRKLGLLNRKINLRTYLQSHSK